MYIQTSDVPFHNLKNVLITELIPNVCFTESLYVFVLSGVLYAAHDFAIDLMSTTVLPLAREFEICCCLL